MKNAFSLTTSQPNNTKALPKRWSERHAKNITSLQKYIFNLPHCCKYTLEKSLIFSDHLTTFCIAPNDSTALEVVRELFFSDHPLTTAQIANFANNMTEDKIQQEIIIYYRNYFQRIYKDCLIFSIPNGGLRDKRTAMLMKATGLTPGASDLIVIYFGRLLFVECKTDVGTQSEEQKVFAQRVRDCGFAYHLVRSLHEFKLLLSCQQ